MWHFHLLILWQNFDVIDLGGNDVINLVSILGQKYDVNDLKGGSRSIIWGCHQIMVRNCLN